MSNIIWWIGAVHLGFYAAAGFSLAFFVAVDWLFKRYKLKADFMQMSYRFYRERNAARETSLSPLQNKGDQP